MELAILSDTHLPRGRRVLPPDCVERLRAADLIIHAGDFTQLSVLEEVRAFGELAAIHGNADAPDVKAAVPATLELALDGVRLVVVHNGGPAAGRLERMRNRFPGADAVVFGHSHVPLHERTADGAFQIFNPGSATDRRRRPVHTMGWASIVGGRIDFTHIELGP